MENLLEKVAQELENAANYISGIEASKHKNAEEKAVEEQGKKEKEEATQKEVELKKVEDLVNPLVEQFSDVDKEASEKLKKAPIEVLEMLHKNMSKTASVSDNWGAIEKSKAQKGNKFAGYSDPIEAFCAMD